MIRDGSTQNSHSSDFSHKRLVRAVNHVNQLWFPPNQLTHRKVRAGLEEGRYELGIEFLVEDLKSDIALLTYCLRESARILRQENRLIHIEGLVHFFEHVGLSTLKQILSVDPAMISPHAGHDHASPQLAQLQVAAVGATTAALLADHREIDGNFAFLGTLLRQIGLTLVAWNYPSVFQRALPRGHTPESLIREITALLGFSPQALALAVMHQWGCGPNLRFIVAGEQGLTSKERQSGLDGKEALLHFDELCRAGEALARANDPEHYPSAKTDWETARAVVEGILGEDALRIVEDRVEDYCSVYRQEYPEVFRKVDPELHQHEHSENLLSDDTRLMSQVGLSLRPHLRTLYKKMSSSNVPRENVKYLVSEVMPKSGYQGGLIYTFDPGLGQLVPRLKFGAVSIPNDGEAVGTSASRSGDPVACAFECATPILTRTDENSGLLIAASFGGDSRVGVLIMEIPTSVYDLDPDLYQLHFKVLRQALEDCLQLSSSVR